MFIFQNCSCCKSWCPECVPDYIPPPSINMLITVGTIYGGAPAGVNALAKAALTMSLTLPLVNKQAYEYGYDQSTRVGPITYALAFTPSQITKPVGVTGEAYIATVVIRCGNQPYTVGWDNQHGGFDAPWRLNDEYDLYTTGWGRNSGTNGLDYNTYETSAADSYPRLRQSELCAPPRWTATKTYNYPMYVYPEFGGSPVAIYRRADGLSLGAFVDADDCYAGDCNQIILTIGPSTPPPPKLVP